MTDVARTSSPVLDLADRFWQWFLSRQPIYATVLGDERYDDRLPDPSAEGRAEEIAGLKGFLADAQDIERSGLDQEDTMTLDMLEVVARIWLRQHAHDVHHFEAIDQMSGPQNVPGDMSRFQRLDTPERLERAILRLEAFPHYLAEHRANLLDGVAAGRTAAAPVVARVIEQVRRAVNAPIDESPLLIAHPELDDASRARIQHALEHEVQPALREHLAALEGYAEFARKGDGVWALPDGDALYRTMILASTTLEEDPQALHDYGLEQLERIAEEKAQIARELGFDDVDALRAAMEADPQNYAKTAAGHRRPGRPPDRCRECRGAALLRPPAQGAGARSARSSPTRKPRRRRRSTSRRRRMARVAASTTSTPTSPRAGRCTGSPRRPSTRRRPATTSRSPSRASSTSCPTSGASAPG